MKAAILGATSYGSRELIKWLLRHPAGVKLSYLGSRQEGMKVSDVFPVFEGVLDVAYQPHDPDAVPEDTDVVFLTLPHTVPMECVPRLLERGFRVIDFSGDYRLRNVDVYEKHYKHGHTDPANIEEAVYGLPEFFADEIAKAQLVANPGCYPTAAILSIAPLAKHGLIEMDSIIVDAKSGVSGAGNKPKPDYHFPHCNESVHAYKVGAHQHEPEIAQYLGDLAGAEANVLFVPHLIPMDRGIFSTAYANLKKAVDEEELRSLVTEFYENAPFIRVKQGENLPRTKDTIDTNFCDIGVRVVGQRAVVVACLDNLAKGMATQAIQNMNIMFGLKQTDGLV
ncbi:MAG: N-acetyl-gamma-glutamyl-phosphate reductase [Planctomycetes bacterium]|nr:N-acetyl-gamma-glutamyl-phosphate reductase [Planctomycetota bacterium]